MMKILIIGGSYFIGWNLVLELSKNPTNTIYVLNRGTRARNYPQGVILLKADRENYSELVQALGNLTFDIVYDISCYNSQSAQTMISALQGKVKRYIYLSTAAVYLKSDIFPIKETFPVGKHHIWGKYGGNKLNAEYAIQDSKFDFTIIRPSYVYGPYNYVPRETYLFEKLSSKKVISIPGDGKAVIQLGHVSDLVNALVQVPATEQTINQIYNISTSEYITLNGLVMLAAEVVQHEARYKYTKTTGDFPFDNESYFTDSSKAKKDFGYTETFMLKQGLTQAFVDWKAGKVYQS